MNQSFFPLRETPIKTDAEKLHDYLIDRNPEGVKKVLMLNGFSQVTTVEQMQKALLRLVSTGKEEAVYQLIEEHPDYELIEADVLRKQPNTSVTPALPSDVLRHPSAQSNTHWASVDFSLHFDKLLAALLFLALIWLVLKIFKD